MRIFGRKKIKSDKTKKKTLQEWLGKLVAPETIGRIIPVRLNKIKAHIHGIEGMTAKTRGHQETVSTSTGNPIMTKDGHLHEYSGAIFAEGKQVHSMEGVTSPASGQDRDHTHKIAGHTSRDGSHSHKYSMETSIILPKQQKDKRQGMQKRKNNIFSGSTVRILPAEPK
jgi:hypothetical protein